MRKSQKKMLRTVLSGEIADQKIRESNAEVINVFAPHCQRMAERVVEKRIREAITKQLPGRSDIASGQPVNIHLDIAAYVSEEVSIRFCIRNKNKTDKRGIPVADLKRRSS